MVKPPKKDKPLAPIKDEPGAEDRFQHILKRALHTPPPRKQKPKAKAAKAKR